MFLFLAEEKMVLGRLELECSCRGKEASGAALPGGEENTGAALHHVWCNRMMAGAVQLLQDRKGWGMYEQR